MVFLHPPCGPEPSGGHLYNRRIVEAARRQGFPLAAIAHSPRMPLPEPGDQATPVLWDSLFLPALAAQPPRTGTHGMLVHYLPFRNPLLAPDCRQALEREFRQVAQAMRFFIATGQGVARELEREFPGKAVFLAEPGVDESFLSVRAMPKAPPAGRTVRIATVANFLPAKGQIELLEALAGIDRPAWEWHLAGNDTADPDYAERFRSEAARLHIPHRIVRHGVLEPFAVACLLGRMDLYAQASRHESYGMALAEAVAAGLPAVTTAVGEAGRILAWGERGFIVPVGDGKGLRDALRMLLADGTLRAHCRERVLAIRPRTWTETFADFSAALRCVAAK